tara:strand:- start:86 stop:505 length:420 start_codon:yes stop_codon:yes gene_type:complete
MSDTLVEDKRFEVLNRALRMEQDTKEGDWPQFDTWQGLREAIQDLKQAEGGAVEPTVQSLAYKVADANGDYAEMGDDPEGIADELKYDNTYEVAQEQLRAAFSAGVNAIIRFLGKEEILDDSDEEFLAELRSVRMKEDN